MPASTDGSPPHHPLTGGGDALPPTTRRINYWRRTLLYRCDGGVARDARSACDVACSLRSRRHESVEQSLESTVTPCHRPHPFIPTATGVPHPKFLNRYGFRHESGPRSVLPPARCRRNDGRSDISYGRQCTPARYWRPDLSNCEPSSRRSAGPMETKPLPAGDVLTP